MQPEDNKRLKASPSAAAASAPPPPPPTAPPPPPSSSSSIHSKYDLVSPHAVAQGAYGKIYRAVERDRPERGKLAIKRIPALDDELGIGATSLREISILKETAAHANIVRLVDVEADLAGRHVSLVFEWMDCDLKYYLEHKKQPVSSPKRRLIMKQLCLAVDFLHGKSIFHRDLKPANVLIDCKTLQVKLADFGLGRRFTPLRSFTRNVVSQFYRSPELLLGLRQYTLAVDVWSLGCIFAELGMRGRVLFGNAVSEFDQLLKIFRALGTPHAMDPGCEWWSSSSTFPQWPQPGRFLSPLGMVIPLLDKPVEMDAVRRCLELDHTKRITARALLQHEYFGGGVSAAGGDGGV